MDLSMPEKLEQVSKFMDTYLPIYDLLDIKLLPSTPLQGRSILTPKNLTSNHIGTTHAGMQWMMMEMIGGIIAIVNFDPAKSSIVVQHSDTTFIRPAIGELIAEGNISKATLNIIERQLETHGKANFNVSVNLTNSEKIVVATSVVSYQLRRKNV